MEYYEGPAAVYCDECSKEFVKLLPRGHCEICWRQSSIHCNGGSCDTLEVIEWHLCSKECQDKFDNQ